MSTLKMIIFAMHVESKFEAQTEKLNVCTEGVNFLLLKKCRKCRALQT